MSLRVSALRPARNGFGRASPQEAWERVAVATQSGAEFAYEVVFDYEPAKARMLSDYLEQRSHLVRGPVHRLPHRRLARADSGGPFRDPEIRSVPDLLDAGGAVRAGIIEGELCTSRGGDLSQLRHALETVMLEHPKYW